MSSMNDSEMMLIISDALSEFALDNQVSDTTVESYYKYAISTIEYINHPEYSFEYLYKTISRYCIDKKFNYNNIKDNYRNFLTKLNKYYTNVNIDAYCGLLNVYLNQTLVEERMSMLKSLLDNYGISFNKTTQLEIKTFLMRLFVMQASEVDMTEMRNLSADIKTLVKEVADLGIPRY